MYAIFLKEIKSFFSSILGYIVVSVFLIINWLFLWVFPLEFNIFQSGYASLDSFFILSPFIFLFLIPAITMRSFSEEKRTGTLELLMTKPVSEIKIILAKFFATIILILFSLLLTMFCFYTIYKLSYPPGNVDVGGTWGSYIGLFMLGCAFASVGIFVSANTNSQVVAFVLSIFLCSFMYFGFDFIYEFKIFGPLDLFIKSLGINEHYMSLSRGVIDTRDVIYFISFIAFFLLCTKISLEKRKW